MRSLHSTLYLAVHSDRTTSPGRRRVRSIFRNPVPVTSCGWLDTHLYDPASLVPIHDHQAYVPTYANYCAVHWRRGGQGATTGAAVAHSPPTRGC